MIYGRPSITTSRAWIGDNDKSDVNGDNLPIRLSKDDLDNSEFFHHNLKLHNILGAILAEFYEKPPNSDENQALPASSAKSSHPNAFRAPVFIRRVNDGDFQSLLRFDTALLQWKSRLPAYLKYSSAEESVDLGGQNSLNKEIAHRQAAVLHAR